MKKCVWKIRKTTKQLWCIKCIKNWQMRSHVSFWKGISKDAPQRSDLSCIYKWPEKNGGIMEKVYTWLKWKIAKKKVRCQSTDPKISGICSQLGRSTQVILQILLSYVYISRYTDVPFLITAHWLISFVPDDYKKWRTVVVNRSELQWDPTPLAAMLFWKASSYSSFTMGKSAVNSPHIASNSSQLMTQNWRWEIAGIQMV